VIREDENKIRNSSLYLNLRHGLKEGSGTETGKPRIPAITMAVAGLN